MKIENHMKYNHQTVLEIVDFELNRLIEQVNSEMRICEQQLLNYAHTYDKQQLEFAKGRLDGMCSIYSALNYTLRKARVGR